MWYINAHDRSAHVLSSIQLLIYLCHPTGARLSWLIQIFVIVNIQKLADIDADKAERLPCTAKACVFDLHKSLLARRLSLDRRCRPRRADRNTEQGQQQRNQQDDAGAVGEP